MSVSRPGSMRGPRLKTLFLLLLLVLLSTLTGTVLCQNEDGSDQTGTEAEGTEAEGTEAEGTGYADSVDDDEAQTLEPLPGDPDATSALNPDEGILDENTDVGENGSGYTAVFTGIDEASEITAPTAKTQEEEEEEEEEGLSPVIILIPVVLAVVIISIIVCGICINRRWKKQARNKELRKEDPYLDGSTTEKVPMPMFEEDVPSVLELEMEELDRWMKPDSEAADESTPA